MSQFFVRAGALDREDDDMSKSATGQVRPEDLASHDVEKKRMQLATPEVLLFTAIRERHSSDFTSTMIALG